MLLETIMIVQLLAIIILGVRFNMKHQIKNDTFSILGQDHEECFINTQIDQVLWSPKRSKKIEKVF